eukprot:CAMPEP_0117672304 /NCGR_PEP_ID=MMETSP0804-20121206/13824_1 /TAXON_ID=1074897 /ORGANISM="Tetraselmis astigmatica, Strain CCMP880" /LENGTH=51 /DNA_ID=CAMNT_0005480879 /DNA_START=92 /DNA_END=243 /DNA_ORIENTATION=+
MPRNNEFPAGVVGLGIVRCRRQAAEALELVPAKGVANKGHHPVAKELQETG